MRKWLIVTLSVVLVSTLLGCGGEKAGNGIVETPTRLRVAQISEPSSLDVAKVTDLPSFWVIEQIGDRLVRLDNDMNLVPDLATEWTWLDDLTLEFKLREGVKFHNGETFTAYDVEFTLRRRLDPDFGSPNIAFVRDIDVDSIEVVNDYTIRFSTKKPFAPILNNLAHSSGTILSKKAVEQYGEDYGQNPVGTGAFKFVNWASGDSILLERFDDYWAGPAKVAELQFRFITQAANRLIELQTGNVHIAEDIAPSDIASVVSDPNLTMVRGLSLMTNYVGLNNRREPFNNVKVRQAMNYALDIDTIVDVVWEGLGAVATAPLNTAVIDPGPRASEIKQYNYDPEKAKQLLAEAGYASGFEFTVLTDNFGTRAHTAEIMKNQLAEIGVTMHIETIEWAVLLQRAGNEGNYDAVLLSWTTSTGDPEQGTRPFYPPAGGAGGNRVWYQNAEVEDLLSRAMVETDWDKRVQLYIDAQVIIAEEAPWVFIQFGEQSVGISNAITGFALHPGQRHRLYDVSFK